MCGNIKGLQDRYRSPTTQQDYAETWGLGAPMVTSFADGSKVSYEQAIVANATGMSAPRGVFGRGSTAATWTSSPPRTTSSMLARWAGIVDYVVGARPAPGV